MTISSEISGVITLFKNLFTILIALAISESIKQLLYDRVHTEADTRIYWCRFPTILTCLLLILRFFHGDIRSFTLSYETLSIRGDYPFFLIFDTFIFLVEAALFFVMSRLLSNVVWRSFYKCVFFIVLTDIIWEIVSYMRYYPIFELSWLAIDVSSLFPLALLLHFGRGPKSASWIGFVGVVIITAYDYFVHWTFYFPKI